MAGVEIQITPILTMIIYDTQIFLFVPKHYGYQHYGEMSAVKAAARDHNSGHWHRIMICFVRENSMLLEG